MEVHEGTVTIDVPEQPESGVGDVVFYNPRQELNRDVTIAVLRAWEQGDDSYLDATAASGIRGVRAATEGWNATCCDHDESAVERCRANFSRNDLDGSVVHRDANAYMHENKAGFDVVDLDPFGTPIPFADAAVQCARSLVCVTATDTAPLCGAHFDSGVRSYSAVPRNTDFHAEMGLRILLSALARTAARYDVGITPVLSHATRHYVRTYLATSHRATDANAAIDELGYVDHCEDCLYRTVTEDLIADPLDVCPNCESTRITTAGPLWLGSTHDVEFVTDVRARVTDDMGTATRSRRLLDTIANEIDTPTHYDQHRLSKQWGVSAIAMDEFLGALDEAGFEASRTHYGGTTFKTDAEIDAIKRATT